MRLIKEVTTILEEHGYRLDSSICEVMNKFKFGTLVNRAGLVKACGFSVTSVLTLLLILPLMLLDNVNQFYKSMYSRDAQMQKDTIYRLKNNERFSWRSLMYQVAKAFKSLVDTSGEPDKKRVKALIIDDTTDQRVGYKMENISHVFDHTIRKTVYGFKILVATFFDGITNIPLDFTIHKEKELSAKKRRNQFSKEVDPKSAGGKRRKEAKSTKADQAIALLKRAIKHGFIPDYVLCDSWFTSEALIVAVRSLAKGAVHLIAGVPNGNRKYEFGGGLFNANEIIALLKLQGTERRCRKWNTRYFEAVVEYKGITVKLFMSRFPRQRKWRVFVTTDTNLSYVQMLEIYGIRWTIEVMFRECKQYLGLGKCQSQDFDAQIASVTITFMLFTFLSYLKRKQDYTTLGDVLTIIQQDVCKKNLAERLFELFEDLLDLAIKTITECGIEDIGQFKESEEYRSIKEILASSFLFDQMETVDNAA
jgi:hypothetical protein